jgi:aryl-alcohol dehydrogenase-like predicted oxidoreductase
MSKIELGLGLLSIGRQWGVASVPPPSPDEAIALTETAYRAGICFFDTAPAYGHSESILSQAIAGFRVDPAQMTIATKMGEYWDFGTSTACTNHSFDEMVLGLENSTRLLGRIDILQLHKADVTNITSKAVFRALDRAEALGIRQFGVSVKDVESARLACLSGRYAYVQFPYSIGHTALKEIFSLLHDSNVQVIINRPFAMGHLTAQGVPFNLSDLFVFILECEFTGIVLTGTSSQQHLLDNIAAFRSANHRLLPPSRPGAC